jgi:diaphanous 1
LEIVLALGNYLNGGTPRGGVYGFKLDGLQKLSTVKSVDNKLTLMNFLAMHCESIENDHHHHTHGHHSSVNSSGSSSVSGYSNGYIISKLEEELSMAEEASRVSLDACRSEITMLKKNIHVIQEQIAAHQQEVIKDPTDSFVEKLFPFVQEAMVEVNKLEIEYTAMTKHFVQLVETFGEEDGTKITTEEFFKLIKEFVESFMKAYRDNEKRRIMQEKAEMKKVQNLLPSHLLPSSF